jgi:hypothetical protein
VFRLAKLGWDSEHEEEPPAGDAPPIDDAPGSGFELDVDRLMAGPEGRRGWLGDARDQLDEHRSANPRPVPKSRRARLLVGKRRLEEEHQVMIGANTPMRPSAHAG